MKEDRGFTLVELMVTVAVLAITMTIAVPSFSNIIQNSRSTALANNIATALNFARSEAVKRNSTVSFCPGDAADASTCPGSWSDGAFIALAGTSTVLKTIDAPDVGAEFDGAATQITFDGQGRLSSPTSAFTLKTSYPNCTGNQKREIHIELSGRVSVKKIGC